MVLQEIYRYHNPIVFVWNGFLPLYQANFEYFLLTSNILLDLDGMFACENELNYLTLTMYQVVTASLLADLLCISYFW